MISGQGALADGKKGAFYAMLEEFRHHWERIDIISLPEKEKSASTMGETGRKVFDNVYNHPSPWPKIFQSWWIRHKGRQLAGERRYALMTVQEYPPFYNGLGARWLHGFTHIPYVVEIHHVSGYPRATSLREKMYRLAFKLWIRFDVSSAAAVRVVNKHEVPDFLVEHGVPLHKIIYIPSVYINYDVFHPASLQDLSAAQYDAIFVGRLARNKGLTLLIDVIEKAKVKTLIVGDGPLLFWLKNEIYKRQLNNLITLHGWARDENEVASLMRKSKSLLMLSDNEGGPRVVVEAMACGLPVIATPVGIVHDVIEHEHSGMIVHWQRDEISAVLEQVLSDEAKYMTLRKNALEASSTFEKKEMIANYAQSLKSLIH